MQKSRIRLLTISFIAAFFAASCASNLMKDYTDVAVEKTVFAAPYFSDPQTDYVYKTNISVYGNELSGIFIVKKLDEQMHRVVFTTEFGNKLIDFEISETDFRINAIVDELNRKILINTLKEDFRLLLRKDFKISRQFENVSDVVYESEDNGSFNRLFVSKKDKKLYKIAHSSKRKEKFSIIFRSENNIFAEHIAIEHQNIKLRIELNYFKNQ